MLSLRRKHSSPTIFSPTFPSQPNNPFTQNPSYFPPSILHPLINHPNQTHTQCLGKQREGVGCLSCESNIFNMQVFRLSHRKKKKKHFPHNGNSKERQDHIWGWLQLVISCIYQLLNDDEVQIVSLCKCVQMELSPRLCLCKYGKMAHSRWSPV